MKTQPKITIGDLIQFISFIGLLTVSIYFSLGAYMNLSNVALDQTFLFVTSLVFEGVCVVVLIRANTALFIARKIKDKHILFFIQDKKNTALSSITDKEVLQDVIIYKKEITKAKVHYAVYILFALLSVWNAWQYALVLADKKITVLNAQVVTNTDITDSKDTQITIKKALIAQNNLEIKGFNDDINRLDKESKTYKSDRNMLLGRIEARNKENESVALAIESLSKAKTSLKVEDSVASSKKETSQFMLVQKALPTFFKSESDVTSFTFMLFSLLIQVGIFLTSPHMRKDEDFEEQEDASTEPLESPVVEVKESVPETIKVPTESIVEQLEAKEGQVIVKAFVRKKRQFPKPDNTEAIKKQIVEDSSIKDSGLITTDEPTSIKEEVPIGVKVDAVKKFNIFIKKLFDNGMNTYLKDASLASREASISLLEGGVFFDYLKQAKYKDTLLIEYRQSSNTWHPNFSSEVTQNFISENYKDS